MKLSWSFRILFCLAGFNWSISAHAWDGMGHMLVDQIAYQNLKPEVRDRVAALIQTLPTKYNNHKPYNFITAGCYMDDIRPSPGYPYSAWHYMNVEYRSNATGFVEPPAPNVLWALNQAVDTIKHRGFSDGRLSESLAMILHFTGDIHQPLHCVDWSDHGGGGYLICGIPFSDLPKKQIASLHSFWDRAYRFGVNNGKTVELYYSVWPTDRPDVSSQGIVRDQAEKIMSEYPLSRLQELVNVANPYDWARESYGLGCKFGYPTVAHPSDHEVILIEPWFVSRAHDIACRRIALAGYRLAALLNNAFVTSHSE